MENMNDIENASIRILDKAVERLKEEYKKSETKVLLNIRIGKFSLVLSARQKAKNDWDIIITTKGE